MKSFIITFSFLLTYNFGFTQTTTIECSNYTQKINRDSVLKVETTFQNYNLSFLNGTITEAPNVKNDLSCQASFNSSVLRIDMIPPKKEAINK